MPKDFFLIQIVAQVIYTIKLVEKNDSNKKIIENQLLFDALGYLSISLFVSAFSLMMFSFSSIF